MSEIRRDRRITTILRIPNFRKLVTNLVDQIARCQKSLYEFLEVSFQYSLPNFLSHVMFRKLLQFLKLLMERCPI